MIKEAIKYITDLKAEAMEPKVVTIAGKTYCDKDLSRYDDEPMAEPIEASNLSSMIDYILSCTKELRESMIIHVISPTKVELYSGLNAEKESACLCAGLRLHASAMMSGTIRSVFSLKCRQTLKRTLIWKLS